MTREQEREELRRFARFGILVAAIIILGGGFLLRDAGESAIQVVGMVGFFSTFVVIHGLDERAKWRRRRQQQDSEYDQ